MNSLDELRQNASDHAVDLVEDYYFKSNNIKGLYCDSTIALSSNLKTSVEKSCVLAEELGHHYTTSGDILDQDIAMNRKQELRARMWAYDKKIGLQGIIKAYNHGCQNEFEMAEYLEVTDEFLQDAIARYKEKYGIATKVDNYIVFFEGGLAVLELIRDPED